MRDLGQMSRDNFSKKIIQILRERVAHRCSNPDCRVVTSGPTKKVDKANNLGTAAHICAASKGGPRYDEKMTKKERGSIDNAIWLCRNCSFRIDNDETGYPVNLLYQWKKEAEKKASQEMGKPLPDNKELSNMLAIACGKKTRTFLPNAISNIHYAAEDYLEKLDPRFEVNSSFYQGQTSYLLSAKKGESVNINLKLNSDTSKIRELDCRYNELIKYGNDLIIDKCYIDSESSKLLNFLSQGRMGKLIISPRKTEILVIINLIQKDTNLIETIGEFKGYFSYGKQGGNIEAFGFNNHIKLSIKFDHDNQTIENCFFTLSLEHELWNDLDINQLPYFSKCHSFFHKLSDKWDMQCKLEKDGDHIATIDSLIPKKGNYKNIMTLLNYTERCRKLAIYLNKIIKYQSNVQFTAEEHKLIKETVDRINSNIIYNFNFFEENPIIDIIVTDKLISDIKMKKLIKLCFVAKTADTIKVFSDVLTLPKVKITLSNVLPCIFEKSLEQIKKGDEVKIELVPGENFSYIECFECT